MTINELQENKVLMRRYRSLLRKLKPCLKEGEGKRVGRAFRFALSAHKDMRRKSGEPFIYHPLAVAYIAAAEMGLGCTSVIAALLHDVVEDTEYELHDIEEYFGKKVAKIIDGLTKIKTTPENEASQQTDNFLKLLLTIPEDIRVILIKIADRLHNMRTLESMPQDKQLKITAETQYIYAPLAHRLGLYSIKSELEDLSLKYSDESIYNEIKAKIERTQTDRERFTRSFTRSIGQELKKAKLKFNIKSRVKSIHSIYRKIKSQGIPFEEVYDLFAIRIIIYTAVEEEKVDCWRAYSIITNRYVPKQNRVRDWISKPKDNGYESLHATVMKQGQWVEVQIRSQRMDEIAEKGYAAHWKYKSLKANKQYESGIEMWLNELREMLENKDLNAIEFLDDFRNNLRVKEIYAFTPKGDLQTLPKGASVIDFAYRIHSEIGHCCLGAKVNKRLVGLNYKIQNGDQIEIITSSKPKTNDRWLKYSVTSKARNKIKEYLREDKKHLAIEGKEVVKRKFKQMKVPFNERNLHKLTAYFNLHSEGELYYLIGTGSIKHEIIKNFNKHQETQKKKAKIHPESAQEFKVAIHKIRKEDDELIIGEDASTINYTIATCCNPLPGDSTFGFITVNDGIKIHRTNCPNATSLMANYSYRIIKARWANHELHTYDFEIIIEGTDRMGLVSDVTRAISKKIKANIIDIAISTKHGIFRGSITMSVREKQEIINIVNTIQAIEGIIKVNRNELQMVEH